MTRLFTAAAVGSAAIATLATLLIVEQVHVADGHMYIIEPVSRQYYRSRIFEPR